MKNVKLPGGSFAQMAVPRLSDMSGPIISLLLCLFASLPLYAMKTGGYVTISDDIIGAPAGNIFMAGGIYQAQGFIGSVDSGQHSGGTAMLESGFYSYLLTTPSAYGYSSVAEDSLLLDWMDTNPTGTDYTVFLSTYAGTNPYINFLSTPTRATGFFGLGRNTTYYAYLQPNYMESDFTGAISSSAVTLSSGILESAMAFSDVGSRSADLRYPNLLNPGAVFNTAWSQASQSLPGNLYGHGSALYEDFIFAGGGHDGITFSSTVYYATVDSGGSWNSWGVAGYLPSARYGLQLLAAKGRLYALGGYNSGGPTSQVWSANISTTGTLGAWREEASLTSPRYLHAAAAYGGRFYVSGGYGTGADAVVRKAEVGDDGVLSAWDPLPDLIDSRYGHTMSIYNGRAYVTGGKNGASTKNTVWKASIDSNGDLSPWTVEGSLPSARYGHKVAIVDGRLVIAGGNNGSAAQLLVYGSSVSADGSLGAWRTYESMSEVRQFHTLENIGGKLCLLGGSNGTAAYSKVFVSTFAGTEYFAQAATDTGFISVSTQSSWNPDQSWRTSGLAPDTVYHFRAKSRNWAGVETAYSNYLTTRTYAAVPAVSTWSAVYQSSATLSWEKNGNPPGLQYYCEISSYPGYVPLNTFYSGGNTYVEFTTLAPATTFYARVRATDGLGRKTAFLNLAPFKTVFDASLDTSSPTVTVNPTGAAAWQRANTALYDVDFQDAGGAGLANFQVMAATDTGGASGIVAGWTIAAAAINQSEYTADWALPAAVWSAIPEGTTAYISVRAVDNIANSTDVFDVFYVLKDITPPGMSLSYVPPAGWLVDAPGPVSSAAFSDSISGLAGIQYSVSSNKASADGNVINWTDIANVYGYSVFIATWTYDFTRLANGASNYFSLRATDLAGNESDVWIDTFTIMKNVSGPVVTITTPTALYLSTLTSIGGYNTETNGRTVMATELSFKDKTTGLYWSGSAFLSGSQMWYVAAGTYPFAFSVNMPMTDGHKYDASARSSDTVGDYSASYATYTFTYDASPPALALLHPADGGNIYSANYFGGTVADSTSGVQQVEAAVRRVSDGKWWDPSQSAWMAARAAIPAGNDAAWNYAFSAMLSASLANGGTYYWTARATDKAVPANTGLFDVYGATFTYYDTLPPGAVTDLAAGAGANPGSAVLTWSASGDDGLTGYLPSGALAIQSSVSSGTVFSTASAVVLSTSGLTAGARSGYTIIGLIPDSVYYFALWTQDDAGNWSAVSNIASGAASKSDRGAISGSVIQSSSQAIQGVVMEAYNQAAILAGSDNTSATGEYNLNDLPAGKYTVKAIWSANDITSSVSKSNIDCGAAAVNFKLSVSYVLAEVTGTIPSAYRPAERYRMSSSAAQSARPYVELFQRGRRVAMAYADEKGRFSLVNLLPGTYGIRLYNGKEFTELENVRLSDGQRLEYAPKWALLNKDAVYAYPNPAESEVSLHFETNFTDFVAEIAVFDVAGRLVKKISSSEIQRNYDAPGSGKHRGYWPLRGDKVASGVYIWVLNIKDPNSNDRERIIKKFAIIR